MLIRGGRIEYDISNQATNIDMKDKKWEEYVVESFIRYIERKGRVLHPVWKVEFNPSPTLLMWAEHSDLISNDRVQKGENSSFVVGKQGKHSIK